VVVPLPRYVPKLNPQERIWHWLQADVTHHHYLRIFAALIAAADHVFATLGEQPQAVVQRIGRAFPSLLDHHLATLL
jgi:hypothetical protein